MKKKLFGQTVKYSRATFFVTALPILLLFSAKGNPTSRALADPPSVEGRWDITMHGAGASFPSWLEIRHSGLHTLVGQFVGGGGSARPISKISLINGTISFSIPPQWERGDNDLYFEASFQGDSLSGTVVASDGKNNQNGELLSSCSTELISRDGMHLAKTSGGLNPVCSEARNQVPTL